MRQHPAVGLVQHKYFPLMMLFRALGHSGIALLQLDDAAVVRVLPGDETAHLGHDGVRIAGVPGGEGQIEQDVGVGVAGDDAQVVDGELRVQLAEVLRQAGAQHTDFGVRSHDGVVVDGDLQVVFFQEIPLDVVDDVMGRQRVAFGRELDVERSELVAGAVIVDHEVVYAQHTGVGHDGPLDVRHQLRRGRFAQQRAEGVHHEAPAGPEDERGHRHAHEAVEDVPARGTAQDGREQDGARGQHVVAAVGSGGKQRLGGDALPYGAVEAAHPELDGDGSSQHTDAEPTEDDGCGVEDFHHRFLAQRKPDGQDGDADHQPGKVFVPGVAVGVLGVRGLGGQPEADEADDVGRSVGQVVQSICHDGDGAEQGAGNQFADAEQQIAGHADQAGQVAVGGADGGVAGVVRVPDKQTDQ